jgi:multidrug efflux system membrane fusion protein
MEEYIVFLGKKPLQKPMKKSLVILFLLAVAGAVVYFAFPGLLFPNSEKLETVRPVRGPAVQAVYATGTVEPSVMIPIAPRQTARLMSLMVDEGSQVKKGQTLAQLEDTDLQNTLTELTAKAELARKELARKKELFARKATPEQDVDQAKADYAAATAVVDRAKAQLSYLKLEAPEDGMIIRREGEAGEMIAANQPVFWMSCCKPLRIAGEVDEEDISLVQPGQDVLISADAFPGKVFNGKVLSITPKGDPVARSYRVRIGLETETELMIGMTAETNIVTRKVESALLVPASALRGNKVWTVENGTLHENKIETGAQTDNAVEITKGLADDVIVIKDASQNKDLSEDKKVTTTMQDWQAE